MEFKRVSVKDLVDVKKYSYGCKFDDEFLKTICDDIDDFEAKYLWYKDSRFADEGYEFYIRVRHKKTGFSANGFIQGDPTDEKIIGSIRRYVNGIKMHMAAPKHQAHGVGWKNTKDKREVYWL